MISFLLITGGLLLLAYLRSHRDPAAPTRAEATIADGSVTSAGAPHPAQPHLTPGTNESDPGQPRIPEAGTVPPPVVPASPVAEEKQPPVAAKSTDRIPKRSTATAPEKPRTAVAPAKEADPVPDDEPSRATIPPEPEDGSASLPEPVETTSPRPETDESRPKLTAADLVPGNTASPAPTTNEEPATAAPAEPEVVAPRVIEQYDPDYPAEARERGAGGIVVLRVMIDESGRIVRVQVEESPSDASLETAAIDAVLRWRYAPATEDGAPVRAWTTETFEFEP